MTPSFAGVTSSPEWGKSVYENLSIKFSLRETVKKILDGVGELKRIQNCGSNRGSVPALALPKKGNPYFMSENCGSSSCPYCASKLGAERLRNLEDGIKSFQVRFPFGCLVMLVLTFSHCVTDSLSDIGKRFHDAKMLFFGQRGVKETLKTLGILGRVTAPETTWSSLNGFHPHEHILFFFESATDEAVKRAGEQLAVYWVNACKAFGLETDPERFYFEKAISSHLQEYVTKCAREVTLADCKRANVVGLVSHYSPFQLVSAYEYTECENKVYADKFREYALYCKGLKSHNWSRGLAELLKVKQYSDKEILSFSETDSAFRVIFRKECFDAMPLLLKARIISVFEGDTPQQKLDSFLQYAKDSSVRDAVDKIEINGKSCPGEMFFRLADQERGLV